MFTKKWCLGIGLVLVLSLTLFAVPVAAYDIGMPGWLFITMSGSGNGWPPAAPYAVEMSPGYEGVYSFTVPASGLYTNALVWFDQGWGLTSIIEGAIDGVVNMAANTEDNVGDPMIV